MAFSNILKEKKILRKNTKILVGVLITFLTLISVIWAFRLSMPPNDLSEKREISGVKIKGMSIESIDTKDKVSILTTTGGSFRVDLENGTIEIRQRIEENRLLAKIILDKNWAKSLTNQIQEGFDYILYGVSYSSPKIIISGDSVIRFENVEKLAVRLYFIPLYQKINDFNGGLLALDNEGGLAIIPLESYSDKILSKQFEDNLWELTVVEPLSLLFVGVCPPRPFDWDSSFLPVIHYSSHIQRYPTDEQIIAYSKYAKVLEMHSWVWQNRYYENIGKKWETEWEEEPLWDDNSYLTQNYKWIPDKEMEIRRVINTAHANGMKFIPYVSLLEGDLEKQIAEMKRLRDTYGIDGLYIDGLYPNNPEIAYEAARMLRDLFGENGWLTLHDTHPTGYFVPFIHAYMDYIITSEHESFNRWTSTSYKISNAIASVWPEIPLNVKDARNFLKKLVNDSLLYNNRITLVTGERGQWRYWRLYFTLEEMKFMREYYFGAIERMKEIGYEKFISELKTSEDIPFR